MVGEIVSVSCNVNKRRGGSRLNGRSRSKEPTGLLSISGSSGCGNSQQASRKLTKKDGGNQIRSSNSKLINLKLAATKMGKQIKMFEESYRYKNTLGSSGVPLLYLIAICFLVIANTSCDQVGSSNDLNANKLEKDKEGKSSSSANDKLDANNFLREIYLDSNSKIISFMSPTPNVDQVQKFHPNGRYGRRSVNNLYDGKSSPAHTELAKLRFSGDDNDLDNGNGGSLRSILAGSLSRRQRQQQQAAAALKQQDEDQSNLLNETGLSSIELEMNKLLKCNYAGIANLYWCDTRN